jgi:hypothetical protein
MACVYVDIMLGLTSVWSPSPMIGWSFQNIVRVTTSVWLNKVLLFSICFSTQWFRVASGIPMISCDGWYLLIT